MHADRRLMFSVVPIRCSTTVVFTYAKYQANDIGRRVKDACCAFSLQKTVDITLNLKKTKKIYKNSAVFVVKIRLMWYNIMN